MTTSPFDLRATMVQHIINMTPEDRKSLSNDMDDITPMVKHLDNLVSGKFDNKYAECSKLDRFKQFVKNNLTDSEYYDWYDFEFTRLHNAYRRTNNVWVDEVYFPRQTGVSRFIHTYVKFMVDVEGAYIAIVVAPNAIDTYVENIPEAFVTTNLEKLEGNSFDQVIIDTPTPQVSLVNGFHVTDVVASLGIPVVKYTTIERMPRG